MVTSASAGEGKTVTTANLGVVLAQAGRRVIMVSSDMRRPTLENYFQIDGRDAGLSNWLSSADDDLWQYLRDPGIPNLRVLPCGPTPSHPAELLSTPQLVELVDLLEKNADLVLFDSPPTLAVADASIIASRVGGIVLVIDTTATHRSAAVAARQHVERAGGTILGTVSNAFDPTSATGYYYSTYEYSESDRDGKSSSNGGGSGAKTGKRRSLLRSKK
jgi:capsular exopolysaccharide synthesis family protein